MTMDKVNVLVRAMYAVAKHASPDDPTSVLFTDEVEIGILASALEIANERLGERDVSDAEVQVWMFVVLCAIRQARESSIYQHPQGARLVLAIVSTWAR